MIKKILVIVLITLSFVSWTKPSSKHKKPVKTQITKVQKTKAKTTKNTTKKATTKSYLPYGNTKLEINTMVNEFTDMWVPKNERAFWRMLINVTLAAETKYGNENGYGGGGKHGIGQITSVGMGYLKGIISKNVEWKKMVVYYGGDYRTMTATNIRPNNRLNIALIYIYYKGRGKKITPKGENLDYACQVWKREYNTYAGAGTVSYAKRCYTNEFLTGKAPLRNAYDRYLLAKNEKKDTKKDSKAIESVNTCARKLLASGMVKTDSGAILYKNFKFQSKKITVNGTTKWVTTKEDLVTGAITVLD